MSSRVPVVDGWSASKWSAMLRTAFRVGLAKELQYTSNCSSFWVGTHEAAHWFQDQDRKEYCMCVMALLKNLHLNRRVVRINK